MTITKMYRACAVGALTTGITCALAHAELITRVCYLTGTQEVPMNASPATGCGTFVFDTDANTCTYRIVYQGFADVAAHIHGFAPAGVNAGVKVNLPAGFLKAGSFGYTQTEEADYLGGLAYVNIHSAAFPGGEIRGQIVAAVCRLDGGQEVPPNGSAASGFGLFNIDPNAGTLSYYIGYAGFADVAAHIHGFAPHGTNAGVQHNLPAGFLKVGVWNYPAGSLQRILDGMCYVNIHSAAFPGGEIRGQIVTTMNVIDGQQEVPANASPNVGCGFYSLDRSNTTLGYDISYGGFAATAQHIHGFAPAGFNAGVVHNLPPGFLKRGAWVFAPPDLANLLDDRTYVNIHSAAFPGGEIRGQINFGSAVPCSPVFTTHPSSATVPDGGTAMFSALADGRTGGTPAYQWFKGTVALIDGARISGATTPTLTINPAIASDSGVYRCRATNTCGSTFSDPATLAVGAVCDSLDFNNDGVTPDTGDIDDLLSVFGGGPCSTDPTPGCNDIDFNNDGVAPDTEDINAFLRVFGGGVC
jgi:hypothetical protein